MRRGVDDSLETPARRCAETHWPQDSRALRLEPVGENQVSTLKTRRPFRSLDLVALEEIQSHVIQVLLGHKKLETTALYAQVATRTLREVRSPLESLVMKVEHAARRDPEGWRSRRNRRLGA